MDLVEGEQLLWRGHPSWRAHIWWLLRWGLVALLPVIIAGALRAGDEGTGLPYWQWVVISLALLVLVVAIDAIRRAATTYTVTTNRLNIRRGILSRSD
jgi:membrane protein YdbS with pleckstrin-like domain